MLSTPTVANAEIIPSPNIYAVSVAAVERSRSSIIRPFLLSSAKTHAEITVRFKVSRAMVRKPVPPLSIDNLTWSKLEADANVQLREYPLVGADNLFLKKNRQFLSLVLRLSEKGERKVITVGKFDGKNAFTLLAKASDIVSQIREGTYADKMLFRDFYTSYTTEINRNSRSGISMASKDKALLTAFGDQFLDDIKPRDIEVYLREKQVSNSTKNRLLSRLKIILKAAVRLKFIEKSPAESFQQLYEKPNPHPAMTESEAEAFVKRALADKSKTAASALLLALYTGLRIGNIISLTRQQIDLSNRKLTIEQAKNGAPLVIPLNKPAVDLITELMQLSSEDYLFPSNRTLTGYITHPTEVMSRITDKMRKHGELPADKRVTIHSLRATAASLWYKKSRDLLKVGRLLGHKTMVSTQRYTQTNVEELREVSELMN